MPMSPWLEQQQGSMQVTCMRDWLDAELLSISQLLESRHQRLLNDFTSRLANEPNNEGIDLGIASESLGIVSGETTMPSYSAPFSQLTINTTSHPQQAAVTDLGQSMTSVCTPPKEMRDPKVREPLEPGSAGVVEGGSRDQPTHRGDEEAEPPTPQDEPENEGNGRDDTRKTLESGDSMVDIFAENAGPVFHYEPNTCRGRLERVIMNHKFDMALGMAILIQAVVMAVHRQYEGDCSAYLLGYPGSRHPDEDWGPDAAHAFLVIEWSFGILFTLEVVLKLIVHGRKLFTEKWDIVDFVIVFIWVVDKVVDIVLSRLIDFPNLMVLRLARFFRFLRLARLIRVLRYMEVVEPLKMMIKCLKAMVTVLVWAALLMWLVIMVASMATTAILEQYIRNPENDLVGRMEIYKSFGSFVRASETYFEITIANWGPPTRLLMNHIDERWAFVMLAYKLSVGMALVQVFMSVCIQQAFKIANNDEELMVKAKSAEAARYSANVKHLFKLLDRNRDGLVSKEEITFMSEDPRVKAWFNALEVEVDDIDALFETLDNGDGTITIEDFMSGINSCKGSASGMDMMKLSRSLVKHQEDHMNRHGVHLDQMNRVEGKLDAVARVLNARTRGSGDPWAARLWL